MEYLFKDLISGRESVREYNDMSKAIDRAREKIIGGDSIGLELYAIVEYFDIDRRPQRKRVKLGDYSAGIRKEKSYTDPATGEKSFRIYDEVAAFPVLPKIRRNLGVSRSNR